MKRIIIYILLMFLSLSLVSLLSGCHKKNPIQAFIVPSEFDASKNYEISFWAKNDTNIIQKKIYQDAIENFETYYPNIKVTMRSYTNYNDIYRDVITNIATNTTPNICISYPDHVATYSASDSTVVSLDNLMNDKKYGFNGTEIKFDSINKSDIYEKFLEECKYQNLYYLLPFMRSSEALYINKTYVEKLGYEIKDYMTWDYIFEISKKAYEYNQEELKNGRGSNVFYPFIYKSVDNQMITMLEQQNELLSDESGKVYLFDNAAKRILMSLSNEVKNNAFEIFAVVSYPGNYFNAEQCVFCIDSTAGATWIGSNAPLQEIDESEIKQFETVVRAIPQYDVDNPKMISQGPSLCIFNKEDSQEVLASWIFTQYLLSNDVQIKYAETEGYIPVTKTAVNSADYQEYLNNRDKTDYDGFNATISAKSFYNKSNTENKMYSAEAMFYGTKLDASKLVINNIDNTFITPVFNGSTSVRNAAGALIEMTVKEVNKKKPVDDNFIQNLFSDTRRRYKIDEITISSVRNKKDLGKLPAGSIILIVVLGIAWIFIGSIYLSRIIRNKKNNGLE